MIRDHNRPFSPKAVCKTPREYSIHYCRENILSYKLRKYCNLIIANSFRMKKVLRVWISCEISDIRELILISK